MTVQIELPKGGYVPCFRAVEEERQPINPIGEDNSARFNTRFWAGLGLVSLVLALAAAGWRWIQPRTAPITIAVLPLENSSHDPANEYVSDGLTDELIRKLSIIDGLAVRSRTSSFAMKGRARNIRDAGQQLQADYILEGSVLRVGPRLRINVQLVRVRDDSPLWSESYELELTGIFAIQDEISLGIVNKLRLKLGHGRRRYETSAEAYDLYLHSRALPQRGRRDAQAIVGLYEQVIAKDPSFAPAYAGLSAAYAASSYQGVGDHTDELTLMRSAAEKAIQLDPLLGEAHQALAMVFARDGKWANAEKSFRRAIELDPSNSMAYCDLTLALLLPLGRIEEGVREMRIAETTDPLSTWVQSSLASALLSAGRFEEAAGHCLKAEEGSRCLGRVRLAQGRIDEAIQILASPHISQALPTAAYQRYRLGLIFGVGHRREEMMIELPGGSGLRSSEKLVVGL